MPKLNEVFIAKVSLRIRLVCACGCGLLLYLQSIKKCEMSRNQPNSLMQRKKKRYEITSLYG